MLDHLIKRLHRSEAIGDDDLDDLSWDDLNDLRAEVETVDRDCEIQIDAYEARRDTNEYWLKGCTRKRYHLGVLMARIQKHLRRHEHDGAELFQEAARQVLTPEQVDAVEKAAAALWDDLTRWTTDELQDELDRLGDRLVELARSGAGKEETDAIVARMNEVESFLPQD